MNNCNFIGRLTKDPKIKKTTKGKAYCSFSLAVDRGYKDIKGDKIVDFIPILAWDPLASTIANYFKKGSLIGINGRMESRTYEEEGNKMTAYSIVVISFDFIQGNKPQEANPYQDAEEVPFDL